MKVNIFRRFYGRAVDNIMTIFFFEIIAITEKTSQNLLVLKQKYTISTT